MVQDMHNPEFFFESFEVYDSVTNEVKNKSGKYRDTANILVSVVVCRARKVIRIGT